MRISNQSIEIPGSVQVTDEYPNSDKFANSHDARDYYAWCIAEVNRMGIKYFVHEDTWTNDDGEVIDVCHIRRVTSGEFSYGE